MVRRSRKPREARPAPARDAPEWDDDDEDTGPRGPRVFDDSDDEPEGIEGDDEEIDSDEAFGEDDDWALPKPASRSKREESEEDSDEGPSDFEDDDGDDIVALSNLLDEAPDKPHAPADDQDSDVDEDEGFEGFDDDLAALWSRKRSHADGDDHPRKRQERTEAVQEGTDAAGGGTKLRLEDLMALGKGSSMSKVQALAEAPSDGRRPVASKRGGGVLQAPLPRIVQDRLDRAAAYKISKDEVQGWAPTIKRLREAEHLSFPLQPAAQPPAASNAGLASKFKPTTEMERSVAALLEEGGLTEKQMAEEEGLAMKALDPEEALRRQTELRRMRELMFRAEQKARRANKIKSKTYRRVHRKERERMQQQLAELTAAEGGLDDEEREELMYKAAKDRAKERATLRHKNTGKWAKLHAGRNDEASRDARLALEEQLRRGDELRKRIHTLDDDDDNLSLDDDDGDGRATAFDELADFEQKEAERDAREEAELEASGKKGKGLLNMKFMKDARERQSKAAQETIQSLKDMVAQEGGESDTEVDRPDGVDVLPVGQTAGRAVYHTAAARENHTQAPTERPSNPFKTGQNNPWLADAEERPKGPTASSVPGGKGDSAAARSQHRTERHAQRGEEARVLAMDDATLAIDPHAQMQAAEASESDSDAEPVEVTKTSRGKRGRGKRQSSLPSMQRDLVSEAFAGDNVALDFVKEKQVVMGAEAPKEEDTTLPGWGSWGGKGVRRKSQKNPRLIKKLAGIDPRNRKDYGMDHVIVNEKLDKKAGKYKAKDLPFPYTSAAQYEAAMRTPIGAEWNTRTQHQRLTLPRVTTKMGQRIDPIRATLDVPEGAEDHVMDNDDASESPSGDEQGESSGLDDEELSEEEGPGFAQFVDPEDDSDEETEDDTDEGEDEEDALRQQITSIPFSKLLKAQRSLRRGTSAEDSPMPGSSDIREKREQAKQRLRELGMKHKLPKDAQEQRTLESRESKNAPTVMSTRRPVSRMRNVVEPSHRTKSRDPRFDSLSAGPVNLDLHAKSYSFIPGMYQNEIQSLRSTYGKLKQMEAHHAGPKAKSQQALQIREEREKVERALRRAESQDNERQRRELERSVKSDFKKENQRRVDAGLRPFFPKKHQLQEAILRKKFDTMTGSSESGSSAALRKALDRKRKKDAQKQKKSLDAALGGGSRTDIMPARWTGSSDSARPHKRGRRG